MKGIEIARALETSFYDRGATRHTSRRGVHQYPHGGSRAFLVMDLEVSRQLLVAKTFTSWNYFQEGMEKLEASGRAVPFLQHFFTNGLLFKEGRQHYNAKREHMRLLAARCDELDAMSDAIEGFFRKRTAHVRDALSFSTLFVRLCSGISIARLTGAPLTAAMRALRQRENIFYFHFHPKRHSGTDGVLEKLHESIPENGDRCSESAWLVAASLVVMGYEPMVATLCAALLDDECEDFTRASGRYSATSFVPRICNQESTIVGHRFFPGDICYVSLVPGREDDTEQSTFPFGLGAHTCAGKRFSNTVLRLAEGVSRRCFPDGFEDRPLAYGDGAFLDFRSA